MFRNPSPIRTIYWLRLHCAATAGRNKRFGGTYEMLPSILSTAKRYGAIALAGLAFVLPLQGQRSTVAATQATRPNAFEVVSIKPNLTEVSTGLALSTPDTLSMPGITVQTLILGAYDLKRPEQIVGLPAWASTDKFDIELKLGADDAAAAQKMTVQERQRQQSLRIQSILEERFGIVVHHESKVLPAYDLTIAKGGLKMTASPADTHAYLRLGRGQFSGVGLPVSSLTGLLSDEVGRTVVDKTNLTGRYQIDLKWAPEDSQPETNGNLDASIFTAVREQLGLKLDAAKESLDVVVVDRIEKLKGN